MNTECLLQLKQKKKVLLLKILLTVTMVSSGIHPPYTFLIYAQSRLFSSINLRFLKEKFDFSTENAGFKAWESLRNPIAEVGREPADHDLVGVVVPEEVDPHTVAVLMPVAALHGQRQNSL